MPAPDGRCALCERRGPIRRSHIVPEHLYGRIYSKTRTLNQVSGEAGNPESHQVRYLQKGNWERLLCGSCEQHLNENGEKHASTAFVTQPQRVDDGDAFLYSGLDYRLMKLYFMSILWRMASSDAELFATVKLSRKTERKLREALIKAEPGGLTFFPCFVSEDTSPYLRKIMWQPWTLLAKGFGGYPIPIIEFIANGQIWGFAVHHDAKLPDARWEATVGQDGRLRALKFDSRHHPWCQRIYSNIVDWPEEFSQRLK